MIAAAFPKQLRAGLLLLVLVGIALILRLALPFGTLSFDEVFSLQFAQKPIAEIVQLSKFETNPPLYYVILHAWISVSGSSDMAIRALSVLGSLLTVLGAYVLCKEIWNQKTGFIAALLLAVSPFSIFFAREARMYPLLTASGVWAFVFLWRYLRLRHSLDAFLYMLFLSLACMLHFGAWTLVACHMLFFLVLSKKNFNLSFSRWVLLQIPATFLVVLQFVVLLLNRVDSGSSFTHHWAFSFSEVPHFIPQIFQAGLFTSAGFNWLYTIVFSLMMGYGVIMLFLRMQKGEGKAEIRFFKHISIENYWVFCMLIFPIVISYIVHLRAVRFVVLPLLFVPLIIAYGLATLKPLVRNFAVAAITLVCLLGIVNIIPLAEFVRWDDLVAYVEKESSPNDLVLIHLFNEEIVYNHYAKKTHAVGFFPNKPTYTFSDIIKYNALQIVNEQNVDSLHDYTDAYSRVFLLLPMGDDRIFWRNDLVAGWFLRNGWEEECRTYFSPFLNKGVVHIFTRQ